MEPFEAATADLDAYLEALRVWRAGAVMLDASEDASTVQLMLLRAATLRKLSIVTIWRDGGRVLLWRKVGVERTATGIAA